MRLLPTIVLALSLCSCSAAIDPSKGTTGPDDGDDAGSIDLGSRNNGMTEHDAGTSDVGASKDMKSGGRDDLPSAIDSSGARFSGELAAGESVNMDFSVFQADRVTMWLKQTNGTSWDPAINVWREGQGEPLVWGNPRGNEDAAIPFRSSDLEDGYEFWFTDTYTLELANKSDTPGSFEFTLECRGGPCAIESGDADVDGTPDDADDCPYRPGSCSEDPFAGLSGGALEDAIRGTRTDHVEMNYVEARVHMFAWIDNVNGAVEGIYTGKRVQTVEIPDSTQMNTEHGWPQSRSGGNPATESDLHHLFPTDPDANAERSSLRFGDVTRADWQSGGSSMGRSASGSTVFEPRDPMKGDIARALFYYAVVYNMDINSEEESALRRWNDADPPDERERRRNQSIANVQRDRNPFVDDPSLVDRISNF
jgi:endonuclease I